MCTWLSEVDISQQEEIVKPIIFPNPNLQKRKKMKSFRLVTPEPSLTAPPLRRGAKGRGAEGRGGGREHWKCTHLFHHLALWPSKDQQQERTCWILGRIYNQTPLPHSSSSWILHSNLLYNCYSGQCTTRHWLFQDRRWRHRRKRRNQSGNSECGRHLSGNPEWLNWHSRSPESCLCHYCSCFETEEKYEFSLRKSDELAIYLNWR